MGAIIPESPFVACVRVADSPGTGATAGFLGVLASLISIDERLQQPSKTEGTTTKVTSSLILLVADLLHPIAPLRLC